MFRNRLPRTALASVLAAATISTLAAAPAGAAKEQAPLKAAWASKQCENVTATLESVFLRDGTPLNEKEPLQVGDRAIYTMQVTNVDYVDDDGQRDFPLFIGDTTNIVINEKEAPYAGIYLGGQEETETKKSQDGLVVFWPSPNPDEKFTVPKGQTHTSIYRHTITSDDLDGQDRLSTHVVFPIGQGRTPVCYVKVTDDRAIHPGLSGGTIAGIVLGVLSALGLIGGLIASLFARR